MSKWKQILIINATTFDSQPTFISLSNLKENNWILLKYTVTYSCNLWKLWKIYFSRMLHCFMNADAKGEGLRPGATLFCKDRYNRHWKLDLIETMVLVYSLTTHLLSRCFRRLWVYYRPNIYVSSHRNDF